MHSASIQSIPNNAVRHNEGVMGCPRLPCHDICKAHLGITYYCTLIVWKCFLLMYTYSPSDGAFIAICVQSIAHYIWKTDYHWQFAVR